MSGRRRRSKVGIALAGGGPLGGIYEIGALLALDEALKGVTLTECDVYVGVSSGAFVVAGLANGISPREMHAMFILDRSHSDPFEPDLLLRPAFGEFARRLMRMPELMQAAAFAYFGRTPARGLFESFARLTRGLPNRLFDNNPIASYLSRLFSQPGQPMISASSAASSSSSPPSSTAASRRRSARLASTTCRFRRRSRQAPLCRASIRRRASTVVIMSTAR